MAPGMRGGMVPLTSLLVACATATHPGSGEGDEGLDDWSAGGGADASSSRPMPDAGSSQAPPGADANPGTSACRGVGWVNALPLPAAYVQTQPGAPAGINFRLLQSRLEAGQAYDVLDLELWDGYGAYAGGPARTGTFTIEGPETVPATCGVCVFLLADVDPATNQAAQIYLAQRGTVRIDSVSGNLSGSLSNVVMSRIDSTTGAIIGDCQSTASGSFDAPIQQL